jgi:thiamine biosynthesis lipoprotein
MSRALPICFLGILFAILQGCSKEPSNEHAPEQVLTGESMGTTYRIKLAAGTDADAAHSAVKQTLAELEYALSTWRGDSWVTRFNRLRSTEPQAVPSIVWPLLVEAQALSVETGGRFDITVGPLVERWGFGAHPSPLPPPDEAELRELLERCGYEKLKLDHTSHRLAKLHPAVELDFGAIAKGYAVDRIFVALEELGHERYLVEFGGDLRGKSGPPGSPAWRIAQPRSQQPILLQDGALATSGPEHQHRGDICHLIDPLSGRAIKLMHSVTASAATCTRADALATAKAIASQQD